MGEDIGRNPLRWDCKVRGCFNILCHPKIEEFAECFPDRISFGDIDGLVEYKGRGLLLEWKSHQGELPTGQRIAFVRLTKGRLLTVLVVAGNAETMKTEAFRWIKDGAIGRWEGANLDGVKAQIRRWVTWAESAGAWAAPQEEAPPEAPAAAPQPAPVPVNAANQIDLSADEGWR